MLSEYLWMVLPPDRNQTVHVLWICPESKQCRPSCFSNETLIAFITEIGKTGHEVPSFILQLLEELTVVASPHTQLAHLHNATLSCPFVSGEKDAEYALSLYHEQPRIKVTSSNLVLKSMEREKNVIDLIQQAGNEWAGCHNKDSDLCYEIGELFRLQ
jgi:hypothetical protein